jgi:hypothetical protein
MTKRHIAISQAILETFHDLDGGQAHEITIHADACKHFRALIPKNEFDEVFETLNRDGCFIGVATKFKGTLWSLAAKGEQTRQEMK